MLPKVSEDASKKFPKLQLIRSNTDIYLASKLKSSPPKESNSTDDLNNVEADFELIKSWENSESLNKELNNDSDHEAGLESLNNEEEEEEEDKVVEEGRRSIVQDFSERSVSFIEKPEVPPKPVEILRQRSEIGADVADDGLPVFKQRMGRWRNSETLACLDDEDSTAVKSAWLVGDSGALKRNFLKCV